MARIEWARSSQFNWVYDNLGGTPLMAAVAGNASRATAQVQPDGTVHLTSPSPGGGQAAYVRGVWSGGTSFAWDGFWADPMDGDLTNYYLGGSFSNQGEATILTLGTYLTPGTPVQLFYLYYTGETSGKYEALNNYPCIRPANRGRDDYTYDFAVDRMLDLMVYLHLAGKERGEDFSQACHFLWDAVVAREQSATSPLVYDTFERQLWERGAYFLYRNDTRGGGTFQVFDTEMALGAPGRVLHVRTDLPAQTDGAWWGYGLNWSLEADPFAAIDRVSFKLQGTGFQWRLHNVTKYGSGSATLILSGDYTRQERRYYVIQIDAGGEVGQATFSWSKDGGMSWAGTGLVTGDRDHPVALWGGVSVAWAGGGGSDLVSGDYWTFLAGEPAEYPRRLMVTLNNSTPGDTDPFSPAHSFVHAIPDRLPELTPFEIPFSQFWRRDNIIDDRDRVRALWGAWYAAGQQGVNNIIISDREVTEVIFGDTFYTQSQVTWDLSPEVTAFGAWIGIDTNRCSSAGRATVNFLIKPVVAGAGSLAIRVKVKDARGSYFYQDQNVTVNTWQRVSVNLAGMQLESGSSPMSHPLQVVDIGLAASPPTNGAMYITDLKFDGHQTFAGSTRLRLLEFKVEQQGLQTHEWRLDDVRLNLEAEDPYPLAPRLAISMGPYGQNPWRGPTLVHYAHPLAPYLVDAQNLSQTYLGLHRDAQEEFHRRYGGVKGPIMPVHTRNDLENIALCGEENFGKFCWWPKYRDYGKLSAYWPFNDSPRDASGNGNDATWVGTPAYTGGLSQPGQTSADCSGSRYLTVPDHESLALTGDFTLEVLVYPTGDGVSGGILHKGPLDGVGSYGLGRDANGKFTCVLNGTVTLTAGSASPKDTWYHVVATRRGSSARLYINGAEVANLSYGGAMATNADPLYLGLWNGPASLFPGQVDFIRIYARGLDPDEIAGRWAVIQGLENGSAYPEVGHALGQYWAFYRLAQYYFVSHDPGAENILENWLAWMDAFGTPDGSGWKFPLWFSEYGFTYGSYDPGAAASLALGCLYTYLRGGHSSAALWARRILDDLRTNRQSQEYGGGYRSDYHYSWLNALVIQAFGVAAHGLKGEAYHFPSVPGDASHFSALMDWLFEHSGDAKPNLLNADLLPFTYLEDEDVWDYAPDYVFGARMGSTEALVLMMGAALAYGQGTGDWAWFERLWRFMLTDNLVSLEAGRLQSLAADYQLAGVKNLVRVYYGDYDQDNSRYLEARDDQAVAAGGEAALDVDLRYGAPVILEDPAVAQLLATRLLKRLSSPWEVVDLTTWLEGARLEIGDTLAVTSPFHGFTQEEFTVFGKSVDLEARRVSLNLARPFINTWAWAVDAAGSGYDAYAIDQDNNLDAAWASRSYAG
jgi:hypothetical protein